MDRLSLVELQAPLAVGVLDDARVLVGRLALPDDPPAPVALTVPTGIVSRAASATGASAKRRPSEGTAASARAIAKARKVRRVPTSGMSSSALANVPTRLPIVEIA